MADRGEKAPVAAWSGPRDARLVIVGEAWGESESQLRKPFAGESGKLLFEMLGQAMPEVAPGLHAEIEAQFRYGLAWTKRRDEWLAEAGIGLTNVFNLRPAANKIESLCQAKSEASAPSRPLARAQYLRPEFLPEVSRLYSELVAAKPNIIVAAGNTACWALLQATNIGSIRGNTTITHGIEGLAPALAWAKVLPTYHPAGVLRQWSWRPIVVADLIKASREAAMPELVRPHRRVLYNPTIEECEAWALATLARPPALLGADIETGAGQIKCISFAPSRGDAICIPFVDFARETGSYWPSPRDELRAWACVRALLESDIPKVGQNFLYDLQYLMKMGIRPRALAEDTMLLHHAMFPEMQKGLGFLGSIYTSEMSWKLLNRPKADTEKRDE